jgi:hypothetical protein
MASLGSVIRYDSRPVRDPRARTEVTIPRANGPVRFTGVPGFDCFRSRREGKRGLRTFCGFAGARAGARAGRKRPSWAAGQGHESGSLRTEMTALSALTPAAASETGLIQQDNEDAAYGPLAIRYRRRLEWPRRRHGDRADRDAILRRPPRADSLRRLPRVSAPRRPAPPGHRGPHDRQTSSRRRLARASARTAPGRRQPACPPRGPGRRSAAVSSRSRRCGRAVRPCSASQTRRPGAGSRCNAVRP